MSDKTEQYWDQWATEDAVAGILGKSVGSTAFWESGANQYQREIRPRLEQWLDLEQDNLCAAELGCGIGRILKPMLADFRTVIGLDVSSQMLVQARAAIPDERVQFVQTGQTSIPDIPDASVDALVAWQVYIHFPDKTTIERSVLEVARVLRPGGAFVMTARMATGWMQLKSLPVFPRRYRNLIPSRLLSLNFRLRTRNPKLQSDSWRGTLLTFKDMNRICNAAGFRIVEHQPHGASSVHTFTLILR